MNKECKSGRVISWAIAIFALTMCHTVATSAQGLPRSPVEGGPIFDVFQHEPEKDDHNEAKILFFRPGYNSSAYNLSFLPMHGNDKGKGLSCQDVVIGAGEDGESEDFLRCATMYEADKIEMFTVANLQSDFCKDLRTTYEEKKDKENKDWQNPIVMEPECKSKFGQSGKCICYQVRHLEITKDGVVVTKGLGPPGNGSGSGGHN